MKNNDALYYRNPNAAFPTWKRVKHEMRISAGEVKLSEGTTFDLRNSVLRWIGVKHSKTCILLEEQKKKGKIYLIGSESEDEVKMVHDKIRNFILDFNQKDAKSNGGNVEDPKRKNFGKLDSAIYEDNSQKGPELHFEKELPDLFSSFSSFLNPASLAPEEDYESLFTSDTFRIFQAKGNKNLFKFNVTLDIPAELLVNTFQDYHASKSWNNMVDDVSLFQKLNSKTYIVLKEDRKLSSKLFNYSREFIFARCFYCESDKPPYYILEKSLDVAEDAENTRGTINKSIYMIKQSSYNKGSSLIAGMLDVSNKGLINASTDTWLTLEYLKQMMNLEQYVSEMQGCGSFQDLEKALDLKNIPSGAQDESEQEEMKPGEEVYKPQSNFHTSTLTEEQVSSLLNQVETNHHTQLAIANNFRLCPLQISEGNEEQILGFKKLVPLEISKGWERTKEGVEFVDFELIKTQHRILGFLLKKMGKNLLMGKSILGVSLPVEIFDNKSVLGRIAEKFLCAPKYFNMLNKNSSDEEITSSVVAFLLTTLVIGIEQHKPFNPILGETYQCWIDGCPLYMEQTFHHPPISSFVMYGPNFKFYGSIEFTASLHLNSASARQLGVCTLELLDCKKEIKFIFPIWNVNGVTFGKRCMVIEGKSYIAIPQSDTLDNLLKTEITFNEYTRISIADQILKALNYLH